MTVEDKQEQKIDTELNQEGNCEILTAKKDLPKKQKCVSKTTNAQTHESIISEEDERNLINSRDEESEEES